MNHALLDANGAASLASSVAKTHTLVVASSHVGLRTVLCSMMQAGGLMPIHVSDGIEALYCLKNGPAIGLLTTLDVPEICGLELLKLTKHHDRKIAVFVLLERQPLQAELDELGASDFVFERPIKGSSLVKAVKMTLMESGTL